jgi:hypothetical protein
MPNRDFDMVSTNTLEVRESPIALLPGMEPVFTVIIEGVGEITTPTMKLFKGSKDVSATNLSGSMSISGRYITCKKIISLTPGNWAFYIYYIDAGIATERFCRLSVAPEGA